MARLRFDRSHEGVATDSTGARKSEYLGRNHYTTVPLVPRNKNGSLQPEEPFLSVIVPARNEASSLPQLVEEITVALGPLCSNSCGVVPKRLTGFEIIVVDDDSTDATPLVLEELRAVFSELRPIRLTAHLGQSAALVAGFRAARGDWFATLDADLQNDPADLVRLWQALPGYDVALGWRLHRADTWSKRVISRVANRVRNMLLGQAIHDTGCSVRLFPREYALRLPVFQGVHRFLGSLLLREGCQIIQVPVNHRPRAQGRSHYNLWNRSLQVVVDLFGVTWLMSRPVLYTTVGGSHPPTRSAARGLHCGTVVGKRKTMDGWSIRDREKCREVN